MPNFDYSNNKFYLKEEKMPLEATMICMDNSEWNRNGDFAPSRWDSQVDAATIIAEAKTQQNPESTVGVLSMAGKR